MTPIRCLVLRVFAAACLLICPSTYLHGQSTDGNITGIVTDTSKAVIRGASVDLINVDTGVHHSGVTNGSGIYSVSGQVGNYRIEVEHPGFKTVIAPGVVLHTQDVLEINFQMALGSTSETVTVSGESANVNISDGSVSTVIDRQFVENLPLNGRSFQSLLYLTPGVTPNVASGGNYYTQGQFVVNGQRGDASYWMIDGVSANIGMDLSLPGSGVAGAVGSTNVLGGTSALVSVDALQEFRIETSTYAPEFGRLPGGQISIQTRSGTNQFHGALFDYLRNGDLDAKDWFADNQGLPKPLEIQNDFGGVLGGPIFKDKTFFFFSAEGLRLILPETFLGTVPNLASRTAAIPAVQPYLHMYPLPKPGVADAGPGYAPYSATFSDPGSADAYSLRIDHQLRNNLNLFARYNHAPSSVTQRGISDGTTNAIFKTNSVTKTATVGVTWTESTQVVNDTRLNYSVAGGKTSSYTDSFGGGTPFPDANLFASGGTFQNSYIDFVPLFGTNMREFYGLGGTVFQHQYNLVDTLSIQRRSHSLKFGVDYRRLLPAVSSTYESLYPIFDNMDDLSMGKSEITLVFSSVPQRYALNNLGLFVQDTWRVSPRLNLTYGLRWDIDFAPTTETGLGYAPVVTGFSTTNLSNLALASIGKPPYSTRYGNVAPRIGGAYRISTDPDWGLVFRAGFGVVYGLASNEIFDINDNEGYYPLGGSSRPTNVAFPTTPEVAALPPNVPPDASQGVLFAIDPNLNLPYALEWNAALEQSLGKAQTFTLSYVGASDKRLLASEYVTNPNPKYATAVLVGNEGSSNFQALQAQFQRRLTNGLQALVSYTWSHSIDTGSYGAYANGTFADINSNRGASDFDVRNALSGAVTYSVPVLKNNLFTRAITGGWSTDDLVQIRSGAPIDVQDANFSVLSLGNSQVAIRPDVVPGQPRYLTGSQYPGRKALNPASFADPPTDPTTGNPIRQGDLSRNARRSLGLTQWDFVARREFPIYEKVKLQFRAELFNVLNHPNFAPFNNQFQTGNIYFGQSTEMLNQFLGGTTPGGGNQNPLYTAGGPRSGELALKLIF